MNDKFDKIIHYIVFGIISILTFFYFWVYIDPTIINFKQQPLFLFSRYFLGKYLVFPGGVAEYLSVFISQFFYSKLLGSILLTGIIILSMFLSNNFISQFFSKKSSFILQFIPGFILIHLHSHYNYDLRGDIMFLAAVGLALFYNQISTNSFLIKTLLGLFSSLILLFLFGGTSLLIFSVIIVLTEIYKKNHYLFWLVSINQIIICATLLYIVSLISSYVNLEMAIKGILYSEMYYKPLLMLYFLFLFIPVLLLSKNIFKKTIQSSKLYKSNLPDKKKNLVAGLMYTFIIIACFIDFKISFNKTEKQSIEIHYYASIGKWKLVREIARELPSEDRRVLFQANRALYHLGELNEKAFNFEQFWGENGLLLTKYYNRKVLMLCSDLYFDMGHIKESLHWAYEAQTIFENTPEILKRIIINNIIIGEYKAAEKFLNILSKSIIHKKWTKKYFLYLHNRELIDKDPLLSCKRNLLPEKDFFTNTQNPEADLYYLFTNNSLNKMAYDYFLLYCLLKHDLSKVAINLKYLEKFNYKKIPKHIEEALLLFLTLNKEEFKLDLGKYQISDGTKQKFVAYSKILLKYNRNKKIAQPELNRKFGNTYWYYFLYISPITNKREIQVKHL